MERPPRKPERPKVCNCQKCVRSSNDGKGKMLPPRTYRNHAKNRQAEEQARRDAFFERFGPPSAPCANVAHRISRPRKNNNSTTNERTTDSENGLQRSPSPLDYPISFQDPPSPLDDLRHSPSSAPDSVTCNVGRRVDHENAL
ncbi:hypothetical protein F5887DRAFT_1105097 [Amanita rubescens]|nr:hypothetical protein F5887DRAFT_1105097 [Amanita rubescens]